MKPRLNLLKPYLSSVVYALLLSACASYPLGMSEAQWLALTPEQQYDAQLKQAELDRQREARRLAEQQAREQALKSSKRSWSWRVKTPNMASGCNACCKIASCTLIKMARERALGARSLGEPTGASGKTKHR